MKKKFIISLLFVLLLLFNYTVAEEKSVQTIYFTGHVYDYNEYAEANNFTNAMELFQAQIAKSNPKVILGGDMIFGLFKTFGEWEHFKTNVYPELNTPVMVPGNHDGYALETKEMSQADYDLHYTPQGSEKIGQVLLIYIEGQGTQEEKDFLAKTLTGKGYKSAIVFTHYTTVWTKKFADIFNQGKVKAVMSGDYSSRLNYVHQVINGLDFYISSWGEDGQNYLEIQIDKENIKVLHRPLE